MRSHWLFHVAVLATLALVGCRGAKVETPDVPIEDKGTRLGDKIDLDLAAIFAQPRDAQAKLIDEWADTVRSQLAAISKNPESVDLLPKLLPPLTIPVFNQAKYSAKAGFSLPEYLEADKKDDAVALHLARFGDHEAAAKLASDGFQAKIAAFKPQKNYPVEWTRLAGLALVSSQLKLALGDHDGATEIVLLHKQIASVLDPKAAEGPLGSTLLSSGKRALERAEIAWRETKRAKPALADDIKAALAEWKKAPAVAPALAFGATGDEVSGLFAAPRRGKAILADKPAAVARVIDLMGLPVSPEGAQVVAAFLDAKDQLAEWQIAYRPKVDTFYPSCGHLAFRLQEAGFTGGEEKKTASAARQTFTAGDLTCEVFRSDRSLAIGGQIRFAPTKPTSEAAASRGFRDFGPVSFDRGYEAGRLALVSTATGTPLVTKDARALKEMASILDTTTPDTLLLLREPQTDVLNVLEMAWPSTENEHALDRLLPSLWDDFGPGVLEEFEDQAGAYLAFRWQDANTRVLLRLAFDDRGPVLSVKDTQPADKLQARAKACAERDEKDRLARIAEGKADVRLTRSPGVVNEFSLAGLKLGQTKAEAEKALPKGQAFRVKAIPGGLGVVILSTPDRVANHWGRQILVRYTEGKVGEIRVRYQTGLTPAKKGESILDRLTDAKSGVPESLPPRWNGLWADLPRPGKITYQRWRDDQTVRTYQQDAGIVEVTWLDRKPGLDNLEPAVWQFLERGIPGCGLDQTRQAVEATLKAPETTHDGAAVYRIRGSAIYEMAIVWYEGDRVVRVQAVHRDRPGAQPKDVAQALSAAWGRKIDAFGYVCRQEEERGQVLGAYYWHDDRVRIETFVRQEEQGPRMVTEWRNWPIAKANAVVAQP